MDISTTGFQKIVDWMEKVSDEQYLNGSREIDKRVKRDRDSNLIPAKERAYLVFFFFPNSRTPRELLIFSIKLAFKF